MTTSNLIYLPPERLPQGVLTQFLPLLPGSAASRWLKQTLPERNGQWVVDPFGASPQLALEAARAGYRVLVISNNPITRFLLEMMASPPSEADLQAALADLATARRGDEFMEQHVRQLYTTHCDQCGQQVDAKTFIWAAETLAPYARTYSCPHCQNAGEFPVTDEDIQKAGQFDHHGQHRARALQRIASRDDPNRFHAEEALDAHLPRAVYALITMINKLDGIDLEAEEGKYLRALLLAACDKGNNLWRLPSEYTRPRQLTTPPRFIEHNLWLVIEEAVKIWASGEEEVPLTFWPEGPPDSGGICLYQGAIKSIADKTDQIPVAAVISALPRPNQAHFTLSALWAGWLWGREAIGPFARVLQRRRYDWSWHTGALARSLSHLSIILPPETPFFGLVTENEAGFDAAALTAADLAGFELDGVALRLEEGQSQFVWHLADPRPEPLPPEEAAQKAREAAREVISMRGEPTPYLHLQAAVIHELSRKNNLTNPIDPEASFGAQAGTVYTAVRQLLVDNLNFPGRFKRFKGGKSSIEIGKWWPRGGISNQPPLADRVEVAVVTLLQKERNLTWVQLDNALCAQFPGLLTPDRPLIEAILNSYAEPDAESIWHLRKNDIAAKRVEDVTEIKDLLAETGKKLGFEVRTGEEITWEKALQGVDLHFQVMASAVLGTLAAESTQPDQRFIVLPGGRAELVLYKRQRDPRLDYLLDGGWRFLKFRHVRRMAESEAVNRDNLASYFSLDPLTHDEAQLPLL